MELCEEALREGPQCGAASLTLLLCFLVQFAPFANDGGGTHMAVARAVTFLLASSKATGDVLFAQFQSDSLEPKRSQTFVLPSGSIAGLMNVTTT